MRQLSAISLILVGLGFGISTTALFAQSRSTGSGTSRKAVGFSQLEALHGALPTGFDIYPADPCAGSWAFSTSNGDINFSVLRYRNLPFVHARLPDGSARNLASQRLGPHTIKFMLGTVTTTVQCTAYGASIDLLIIRDGQQAHRQLRARNGILPVPSTTVVPAAETKTMHDRPEDDLCSHVLPRKQTKSLDGGFIYQQVCRSVTSDMIVQVRLSDGHRRDVTDGNSLAVIRNGPWRGMLLLTKHKYKDGGGSYDATWVVRPDGKEMFQVPGTEDGDLDDKQVTAWLRSNGWIAN